MSIGWLLAYHAGFSWAKGGFLGVSLFFTLSGFLIGGLLFSEHRRAGSISLRRFWSRRIRRLAPASFLALGGIVLFEATVASPGLAEEIPRQVLAAALYLANWEFITAEVSYADLFDDPSPVQHFWSLSVEEQFYVFLPLFLIGILGRTRSRRTVAIVLAGLAAASVVWASHLFDGGEGFDRVYYGTDARLAEFLIGVLLALVLVDRRWLSDSLSRSVGWVAAAALGAVLWSFCAVSIDEPGLWSSGGIVLFALLSACVITGIVGGRGPLRVLSWGPLTAIGRVSYGLYLFHFPIFLWLTEERTGLDVWPLFVLRLGVTATVAIASYHLIEMPVRRGASLGLPLMGRVAALPLLVVLLLVTSVVVTDARGSGEQTFGEEELTAPPVIPGDPVLDVLVISDERGAAVAQELEKRGLQQEDLVVTVASPFACGSLVESEWGMVCAEWADEWPGLVERHDPDAVLLYLDHWPEAEIRDVGEGDHQTLVRGLLTAGFQLLGERGAPVVWVTTPPSYAEGIRQGRDPFYQAMIELRRLFPDLSRIRGMPSTDDPLDPEFASEAADAVLTGLATHRRRPLDGKGRVMVVGDSQAQSVAHGLERWSAVNRGPAVWNAGVAGCGLVEGGEVIALQSGEEEPADPKCAHVIEEWLEGAASFGPDRVVVLTSLRDLQPRRLDGWADFSAFGDDELDAHIVDTYVSVAEAFEATGADVVWLVPPCVRSSVGGHRGPDSPLAPAAVDHLRDVLLPRLVEARPTVELYEIGELLCPGGEFLHKVDGVGEIRPDGIHLTSISTAWLAELIGPDLLDLED